MIRVAPALLLLLVALAGCAGRVPLHPGHFIMVHEDGYPLDAQLAPISDDEFGRRDVGEILQAIDGYVRKDPAPGFPRRLVLFIHGGLNPYRNGLKRVDQFVGAQGAHYPAIRSAFWLFVNWNSDLLGSLVDDLCCIRRGDRAPLGGALTAPFVTGARVVESGILAPRAWWFQGENAVDGFGEPRRGGDVCDIVSPEPEKGVAVAEVASYFLLYPVRALTAPVIQAFGSAAWDQMKRRADLIAARIRMIEDGTVHGGAGYILLKKLADRLTTDPKWKELEVVLMGHSMGAIVLSRLLEEFPELPASRIVFLGAAASIQDVEGAVIPYLLGHPGAKFWGFSLSETDEAREISGLDVYERGSLLVWIDNLFERVNVPSQRTFGRAQNLRQHFRVPAGLDRRMFLMRFDGKGRDDPRRHGDFDKPRIVNRILGLVEQDACPSR